ncbi:MAG: hypothetical protein ACKOBZ_01440 [Nitrospira sp.]
MKKLLSAMMFAMFLVSITGVAFAGDDKAAPAPAAEKKAEKKADKKDEKKK